MLRYILFVTLFTVTTYSYAQVQFSDLIEVNDKIREKCVEYYTRDDILYCSTKAFSATSTPPDIVSYEKQHVVFDGRMWKLAWGKQADGIISIEYVPMGEDINDWHELITSQYLTQIPPNISPRSLAERTINEMNKMELKPIVTYHTVTQDQVIFEFRIDKPENLVQDELQMISKRNDGIYILHYVIREADMGKANRDKWLGNFAKSTIK